MKKLCYTLVTILFFIPVTRILAQQQEGIQHPTLITRSLPVFEVPSIASQIATGTFIPAKDEPGEVNPKHSGHNTAVPGKGLPKGDDPLWSKQVSAPKQEGRAPILNFDAATATATPTDPTGAVGPNHFMNAWNTSFRIWNKSGTALTSAASLSTVLPGTLGDPIVLYDPFADRFLLTEFYEDGFDVAITKGPDPVTSGWWVYRFPTSSFPDYPKFSVWSDGYYITANKDQGSASTSQVVFALERDKMLTGNTSAQMIGFPLTGIITSGFYSPLGFNANGPTPPPAGNAPIVYMQDDSWSGVTTDHLKIWNINVNWTTPSSSTISSPQVLNTTPFDGLFDNGSFVNLPQPSGSDIDALQATIMYMAQYRRFSTYNSVVFNFVVDLDGNDNKAGIRWYELRQTADGQPWTIYQEGTYAQPNGHSAFCGNMCIDVNGNIGMAYTIVSSTKNPSLRFTGRYASDPVGTMTLGEEVIIDGASVDPSSRYGDYSQMTVDPSDGTTLWTVSEYFNGGRRNRCATFQIAPPALTAMFSGTPTTLCAGGSVTFTDASLASPTSWTWSFPGGTPSSYVGQTPPPIVYSTAGTYDVTLEVSNGTGTDSEVKTGYITVKNVIADFSGTPTTVVVGNSVTFTDNSSCSPATWEWAFPGGDPSSYSGQAPPAITYSTVGNYNVSLTVTKSGSTDTKTKTGYVTVAPPVFNMTNGTVTTCGGDFYDSGGSSGAYQNNETYVMTFYPSTAGNMIRFTFSSFTTESGYDYLYIYNGTSTSATLIGTYNGSTGPGTVTATNAAGALTFKFTSDVSLTYAGWAASISCYNPATPPVANFSATPLNVLTNQTVTFTDLTTNAPTSWSWSFTPNTVSYVDGTSATSQNPHVQFTALGLYTVTLTAMNAYGSDGETKTNYITVSNTCLVSTLPWSEGFAGTTIPNCWTQVDHQGNGQIWKFGTITGYSTLPALTGNYAYLNSDGYGSGNSQNADLVTPTFDLSSYTNITLGFKHYFRYYSPSSGTVSYSINNGTTWTTLATYTSTTPNPATFSQVIAAAAGQSQVKFRWNYTGTYGYYWGVDDISVTGTCAISPSVSVSIAASANPVDEGTVVTFTATPVNGGATPAYQWKVNGSNAGTNSSTYAYSPANGDVVTCVVTSSLTCVTGNPATSNTVTMTVNSVPVNLDVTNVTVSNSQCFDATSTITVAGSGTTFEVNFGGIARFYAGELIIYNPGTWVKEGGYMLGTIVPGGPYCPQDTKQPAGIAGGDKGATTDQAFFRLYPNPTTDRFTLELDRDAATDNIRVEIYDMQGEKILWEQFSGASSHDFNLYGRTAGIYLVRVTSGKESGAARIIKQH